MSLKRISECVSYCADIDFDRESVSGADEELMAIRRAAAVIHASETGGNYSETERAEAISMMGRIAQEAER